MDIFSLLECVKHTYTIMIKDNTINVKLIKHNTIIVKLIKDKMIVNKIKDNKDKKQVFCDSSITISINT